MEHRDVRQARRLGSFRDAGEVMDEAIFERFVAGTDFEPLTPAP